MIVGFNQSAFHVKKNPMADDSEEEQNNARIHQNQPYDESLEVPDAEEVASTYSPTPRVNPDPDRGRSHGSTPPEHRMMSDQSDDEDDMQDQIIDKGNSQTSQSQPLTMPPRTGGPGMAGAKIQQEQFNSEDEEEETGSETSDEDDDDDDDDEDEHQALEGAYDPQDYENLPVTPEIKELFQYITRYTPQSIELEHKIKPFIPDFLPSVGDIDAFIKIPRPDNKPDTLGLSVLDEPCAKQSDPVVLDLQLRAISKQSTDKKLIVKSLESAEKNPKHINNWIESIRELHRSKPPPNVHYSKNMPDIDTLMQEWPSEFEELLKEVGLPTADLNCELSQYVDIICSVLDIPIYKNTSHHNERIQALHVLFTLYSEFKNSQHFRALAEDNKLDNKLKFEGHHQEVENEGFMP
ncbi:hypothetical protein CHS0354_042487 [Potamilus streckersoni]|uniref:Intraflagellar transport protein 46 homolog n=1 Tax=Potamilus streckersoni TaxID=2493646 RepID=A0AAE0VSS5_9BIVA|nr:hypothetical protein CHS0354_042487 [Potamilus streckersoni]